MNCAWSVLYHGIWGQLVYFWNSNDKTGTTLLHSLSLTFTNQVFHISFYFSDPHEVISIRAPQNGSVVRLSCSFQTVGWSYNTVAAPLSADQGGHTPSVSHVGWNWIRVLTVTMSGMKMLFTSGEQCPLCCPSHQLIVVQIQKCEHWAEQWRQRQRQPRGWDSCHTWVSAAYVTTRRKTAVICLFM